MGVARILLMLLGAVGVLMLGAVAPSAAATESPPCHEMGDRASKGVDGSSEPAMKPMGCCVACIAAPAMTPPSRTALDVRPVPPRPLLRHLPTGRRLSPETGPPKA